MHATPRASTCRTWDRARRPSAVTARQLLRHYQDASAIGSTPRGLPHRATGGPRPEERCGELQRPQLVATEDGSRTGARGPAGRSPLRPDSLQWCRGQRKLALLSRSCKPNSIRNVFVHTTPTWFLQLVASANQADYNPTWSGVGSPHMTRDAVLGVTCTGGSTVDGAKFLVPVPAGRGCRSLRCRFP